MREPGLILQAYSRFHGYSLGNRLAALMQCHQRGLEPGPIHTYMGWQQLGRQVRSGEKALWLCMPLTRKIKGPGQDEDHTSDHKKRRLPSRNKSQHRAAAHHTTEPETGDGTGEVISAFVWKPHWFVLAQTDCLPGQEETPQEPPALAASGWDKAQALRSLDITEVPFDHLDGNCQGFAKERSIAVSPIAALPHKTRFHEMAHVVLGHTLQGECIDGAELSRQVREAEAESVALLLLATLELPGQEYCRGYIRNWLNRDGKDSEGIPESSARRIFGAADKMLQAGLIFELTGLGEAEPVAPSPAPSRTNITSATTNTTSSATSSALPTAPRTLSPQSAQATFEFDGSPEHEPKAVEPKAPEDDAPAKAPSSITQNGENNTFPYPKINWAEWEDGQDTPPEPPFPAMPINGAQPPAPAPVEPAPALSPPPAFAPPADFPPRDEGELALYHWHSTLILAQSELCPVLPRARQELAETLRYLEEKDPVRAELVRRCVHLAGHLIEEAAGLLNEGIHWPTVETLYCPPEQLLAEEPFLDTPQNWLAVGQAKAETKVEANGRQTPESQTGKTQTAPPMPESSMPPALAALVQRGLPPLSPTREVAARRSLGSALKMDRDAEQRRFYAIAREHGLPTGPEAAPAMRAALSQLFGIPVESRRDLTARQWGQAASAIETQDLLW